MNKYFIDVYTHFPLFLTLVKVYRSILNLTAEIRSKKISFSFSFFLLSELSLEDKLYECKQLVPPLLHYIPNVIVSLGKDGVLVGGREGEEGGRCFHYPSAARHLLPVNVLSVTGAGDR